jgi:hypothetical protein
VVRQRHPTEDETAIDDDRVVAEDRTLVPDERAMVHRSSGDPVHDDALPLDADITWARPSSDVGPTAERAAPEPATSRRTLSWGQVLILLAGVASLVFGLGAVALAGLAGSVTAPVVTVFTYDHTPLLGLIETGAGVVLVLAALVPGGRWVAGPVGVAAIVGGALVIAELEWTRTELAAQPRFGWVAIAVGTVAYLGAIGANQEARRLGPLTRFPSRCGLRPRGG